MLFVIGIGINEFESLPLGSIEILRSSDIVYVERFTGFISDEFVQKLSDTLQKKSAPESGIDIEIKFIKRWFIEDGRENPRECSKIARLYTSLWGPVSSNYVQ